MQTQTDADIVIGTFYKIPSGEVVYTYGWDGRKKEVHYRTEDGPGRNATEKEVATWERLHIRDFPNAKDPRLPYVFDLLWDIKYMSQLRRELRGHVDEKEIRQTMKEHGVTLGKKK